MQFLAEQHVVAAKSVRENGARFTGIERELFIKKSNSFVACARLLVIQDPSLVALRLLNELYRAVGFHCLVAASEAMPGRAACLFSRMSYRWSWFQPSDD